ncbi:signal recognition particle-docking protein FtsY [Levilactobacillus bambusae]|uniref:Signal recognition particle receptor FtsY n=1 Tax=Levilactobacillus bambusae TaxID=2024736 RepID=A0A2V1N1K7_9LACO|nr:signal recognition particle-docking protein FtsY [Levilactobacillus bambusae]PWG00903.1 signal recognition particle-docking protein FtsY [Levilactobacillus bambusae]
MGLFDIFKRRSKRDEEANSEEPVTNSTAATSASADSAVPTAGSDSDESLTTSSSEATSDQKTESSAAGSDAQPAQPEVTSATSSSAAEEAQLESSAPSDFVGSSHSESEVVTATDSEPVEIQEASSESSAAVTVSEEQATLSESAEVQAHEEAVASSEDGDEDTSTAELYDRGLEKSRTSFGDRLNSFLAKFRRVDESFFDDLEETLIEADVGYDAAMRISDELRDEVKLKNAKNPKEVQSVIVEKLVEIYDESGNGESTEVHFAKDGPTVILFVGVNGVGKTTTIGKMAARYKKQGKKVLLAAADTFRAGATEQLDVWAKRDGVDIVVGKPQSDPAAVVFDGVKKAKEENYDILFIDTAGRLQNKVNLMNELEKMKRIITREIPEAPHEVLLVLDATTGQNALNQAKMFKDSTDVTGIVLTKLDGTARGGIVLAIRNELHVPVKFAGLGEQVGDLRAFDPNEFVYGLFKGLIDVDTL